MKDFRILLKNVRPYAGLFTIAFLLMTLVGVFEAGRTALVKSIIDGLAPASPVAGGGLATRIDVSHYLPGEHQSLAADRRVVGAVHRYSGVLRVFVKRADVACWSGCSC